MGTPPARADHPGGRHWRTRARVFLLSSLAGMAAVFVVVGLLHLGFTVAGASVPNLVGLAVALVVMFAVSGWCDNKLSARGRGG